MSDTWTRITDPGTGSPKSLSNINTFLRHLSLQTENYHLVLKHKIVFVLKHLTM